MKILVLGATGMAGHIITLYLKEQNYDITAFSKREFIYCNNLIGDVTDEKFFRNILSTGKYDVVINCIGLLNKDCDNKPALAVYLNSYLPHMIVDELKETDTKYIHMSTDCVFSGKKGSYSEESFKDGETFYDRTKALGEINDLKNLTFRNSIIGPDINENGIGLFNWFMKQEGIIYGYDNAIWTGVTTLTLAKAIEAAIKENISGIYNLVNNDVISKYELCKLFNKHFKNDNIKILKNSDIVIDKSLINTRLDFSFKVPTYEDMIIDMKNWIYSHKELYKHYFM